MKKLLFIAFAFLCASLLKAETYTEFTVRSGGSNLNSGTRHANAEAGTAADFTYANGTWTVFSTSAAFLTNGNPSSDGVVVADWASVYANGSSSTSFIARVLSVGISSVQVSLTAKGGVTPVSQAATMTMKIGGAWAGPNGTSDFPINMTAAATTDLAADPPRINFKNDVTYSITATMSLGTSQNRTFQGYTTTFGDGGKAIIDGGTSTAAFTLLSLSGTIIDIFRDLIFQNNGNSGSADLVACATGRCIFHRCVFAHSRGNGLNATGASTFVECEAFDNNQSNTAGQAGFRGSTGWFYRCISHDNTGSNTVGFLTAAGSAIIIVNCIADTNGASGFSVGGSAQFIINPTAYNNTLHGIFLTNSNASAYISNPIIVSNGGFGINISAGNIPSVIDNPAYFQNTSGPVNVTIGSPVLIVGTVTLTTSPFVDAPNGNFQLNNTDGGGAACRRAGRGNFTETSTGYSGTLAYPDIGAVQHQENAKDIIIDSTLYDSVFQ